MFSKKSSRFLFILLLSNFSEASIYYLPVQRPYSPQEEPKVLRPPYVSPGEPVWTESLFTDKLIADFYRKYEEEIGVLESTRLVRTPPDLYDQYTIADSFTFRKELIEQNESFFNFGEYITLKTFEFHVDEYLRSHPNTKKAYEVKLKYTNADFKLGKNKGDFKFKYSVSGNFLESQYLLDDLLMSYKLELKKHTEGFLQQSESKILVDYVLPRRIILRILYFVLEKGYSVILRKSYMSSMTISLSYNGERIVPDTTERDNRIMIGAVFYLPPSL